MDHDQEVRRLFDQALDVPSQDRSEWLERECDDPAIRAEVERLLKHDPGTDGPEDPPGAGTILIRPELPPKTRIDDFEIVRELGRGSMGAVYLAREVSLDRLVALKMVVAPASEGEDLLERFRREARTLAKLDHRGIVPVYRVGVVDGRHFIAMAYIPGETLAARLTRERSERDEGKATPTRKGKSEREREVARLLADVAEALDHAHRAGVIHRDVKPSNIMIDLEGQTHLMDFGIARDLSREGLTLEGGIIGTCRYMSPEQARAAREEIDARSDVFSLGVVLYEVITLQQPFGGETVDEILGQVIMKEPKRLRSIDPGIPRDLETIVHKALEKERKHRYQSAAHIAADLRSFVIGHFILARPPAFVRRLRERVLKHKLVVAAALTLLLGLTAGAWWQIWLRSERAEIFISAADPELQFTATLYSMEWGGNGVYPTERLGEVLHEKTIRAGAEFSVRLDPGSYRVHIESEDGVHTEAAVILIAKDRKRYEFHLAAREAAPKNMALVPAQGDAPAFWIDQHEVSNQRFLEFLNSLEDEAEKTRFRPWWWGAGYDKEWDRKPVTGIPWEAATRFARWEGKRLPTADEWDRAVQGAYGRRFPWSPRGWVPVFPWSLWNYTPTKPQTNAGPSGQAALEAPPLKSTQKLLQIIQTELLDAVWRVDGSDSSAFWDKTDEGVVHLYGNVCEWTASVPPVEAVRNPKSQLATRVVKGRAWQTLSASMEIVGEFITPNADVGLKGLGFRCARTATR